MTILLADLLSRTTATIAGILLLIATTSSLLRTVVMPRTLRSYISELVARAVIGTTRAVSRIRKAYVKRDGAMAWAGPSILILQLITWLLLYLLAYGLILYGISGQTFGDSMRQAGSSLFTLGFADTNTSEQTFVDFLAAATGPIVIAMMIGFLPTIYSTYLDRESMVTRMSVSVGEPAWGPEMLSRHALTNSLDRVGDAFQAWSSWAATMRMSHTMFPVLLWVRSSRPYRHYLTSLLAALDAASLVVALTTSIDRRPAFQLIAQGGQAMEVLHTLLEPRRVRKRRRSMRPSDARAPLGTVPDDHLSAWNRRIIAVERATDADELQGVGSEALSALRARAEHGTTLTRADLEEVIELLRNSGFPVDRSADEAWDTFSAARGRYEYAAYAICEILDAPPAPWSGRRRTPTATVWPHSAVALLPPGENREPGDHDGPFA